MYHSSSRISLSAICSPPFRPKNSSSLRARAEDPGKSQALIWGVISVFERRAFKPMRAALLWGAFISLILWQPALAQDTDDTLLPYAVHIHQTPMQNWGPGAGIYLGKGLFITAAHVAGRSWLTRPKVAIAGVEYPTRVVKEGSFEGTDLTLLSVEEDLLPARLWLRRNVICSAPPVPGQEVVTIVPGSAVRSHILAPDRLPADTRKRFNTVIADVARTGNSGSGVFDVKRKCLLGIMSRKISQSQTRLGAAKPETRDIAKYFVPAAEIAAFLPADLRL
ncbi:serine protease [Bradyrhizobium sp. CB3481]|uniref:S1 family peptidase n=1 Tax=Bradyrhizobium sp. CB3481 TaxID=3039158 RepID=UPI0024B0628C|nr:serine protease [Bradyrhizobium sp. CB3481]WFU18799.1 serine protease [Bradyrhizobium sp. CB3481]